MPVPFDIIYMVFQRADVPTQIQMSRAVPSLEKYITRRTVRKFARTCIESCDYEGLAAISLLEKGRGQYIKEGNFDRHRHKRCSSYAHFMTAIILSDHFKRYEAASDAPNFDGMSHYIEPRFMRSQSDFRQSVDRWLTSRQMESKKYHSLSNKVKFLWTAERAFV